MPHVAGSLDTVKSRLQTQKDSPSRYTGIVDCFLRVSREEGVLALYSGYSTAVIRAGFVGAAVFYTYELARCALG